MIEVEYSVADLGLVGVAVVLDDGSEQADHVGEAEPFCGVVERLWGDASESGRRRRRQHAAKEAEGEEDADVGFGRGGKKLGPGEAAIFCVACLDAAQTLWVVVDDGFSKGVVCVGEQSFVFFVSTGRREGEEDAFGFLG